ncbi:hypothetical protein AB0323_23245, partial [Arthrobacter sp. NPDC080031]|uniref:hypothetical protein n=1 Tax=Arthrobacter sp. NPDC080031 TaxID=3155918 RepID=UPI00344E8172
AGQIGGTSAAGETGQDGNGAGNGRHGRPALRTPGCPSIHTHSIAGGTDNLILAPLGAAWRRLAPLGAAWRRLAPLGAAWRRLAPLGACAR